MRCESLRYAGNRLGWEQSAFVPFSSASPTAAPVKHDQFVSFLRTTPLNFIIENMSLYCNIGQRGCAVYFHFSQEVTLTLFPETKRVIDESYPHHSLTCNCALCERNCSMSTEDNKALVRRFYTEVLEKRNPALVDELFATTYVYHYPDMPPDLPSGLEGFKKFVTLFLSGFSNLTFTIDDQTVE